MGPKDIRTSANVSQLQVAARAGVSIPTVRAYELDPKAVKPGTAKALAPIYDDLARQADIAKTG